MIVEEKGKWDGKDKWKEEESLCTRSGKVEAEKREK